jgi:hypothetical protein
MLPLPSIAAVANPLNALVSRPAIAAQPAGANDRLGDLLRSIESRHAGAHQQVVSGLAGVAAAPASSAAMLRLQAAVGEFTVRVQLSVRLAEELSRSVQTLTQRT